MFATPLPTAGVPRPAPDADIRAQIAVDRVQLLYELTPRPVLAGMVFAVLVAAMMWPVAPLPLVVGWLVFKLGLGAVRIVETRRHARAADRRTALRDWLRRYAWLMALDAASWGAMAVLFMPHASGIAATVLLGGAIGVAAVAVFTTFSHRAMSLPYVAASLAPIVVDQALAGERDSLLTAAAVVLYAVVLGFEAWRSEARLTELLRLRYENAWNAEQRQQALALAEHSSAAKSRFLAAVSHEMRTPLNGLLGMTQLMHDGASAEQLRQLDVMRRSARHLQTVIGDLLDLSRIEFGRLELERAPLPVIDTVREVTDLLSAVAADRGLDFRAELIEPVPTHVIGDAGRIKQVLHNLLGNALKFTRAGEVSLQVSAVAGGLLFSVQDSGDGIPPGQAETIFDAFAQAGHADARRAGTGLGLAISRQLARAMGGDVTYQPAPGGGALFHFAIAAPAVEVPDAADAAAVWTPPATRLSGDVLVVDDSPVNALVARGMLERFGLAVDVADDGAQALQRLRDRTWDLVLMDCQMPVLDGLEATRRWRAWERAHTPQRRLPIVALTANAVVGDRERCLAAGMDDYLAKPFDMNELAALLQRHLAGEPAIA